MPRPSDSVWKVRPLLAPCLFGLLALILIAGFARPDLARADRPVKDSPVVEYRQKVMSNLASNMGAIGDILKHGLQLPGNLAIHAEQMAASARLIGPAFRQNVAASATDAKPEIWEDWAKFESAIADYERAAQALAAAAATGESAAIRPAVKALGKSCGGCHKPFRKPKEESYHRESSAKHDHSRH